MIYIDLIHNLSALVALSVLSFFIDSRWSGSTRTGAMLQGLLFGTGATLAMFSSVYFANGVIFDARSVGLSLVSLYFGPFAGIIAGGITLIGRTLIGGAGAFAGSLTIVISVGIGLVFYNRRRLVLEPPSLPFLYGFGMLVHVALLISLYFSLPDETTLATLEVISLPMLITYPVATLLIGKILSNLVRTRVDLFALSRGKTFFQSLFREHAAIKLLFDPVSGTILEANDAAIAYYGWTADEMKSKRIQEFNILSEEEVNHEIRKALELKKNHFTFRHQLKNGSIRDVDVYSSPITIDGNRYLYSIIHDVTERVLYEQQVHLQISALNSASNGIVITDTKGTIIWANRSFTEMTGYDPKEAFGRNPRDLVKSGEQSREYYATLWNTILSGEVWNGELVNRRKDGTTYFEEMTITPVKDRSGNITHFIAIKQNITDRKHIEEQISMNIEELKKTNSELDRFVYSTSHDLRAPLLSVLGLIELNMESLNNNQEAMDYLLMMKNSIHRADDTIKQILNYSRNSRLDVQIEPVNLCELVDHHIHDIRHMVEANGVRFEVDIPKDCIIHTDSMRIRIIVQNLITNAVKYQRPEETDKWVGISVDSADDRIHISVEDNGEGIHPDKIDSVFEMFKRESSSSTGAGLGLYMVREMATRLQGTISVTSTLGKGSRFLINLPQSTPNANEIRLIG